MAYFTSSMLNIWLMHTHCHDHMCILRFADNSFDLVLEKSMIDSMFCSVTSYSSVVKVNQEVCGPVCERCEGACVIVWSGLSSVKARQAVHIRQLRRTCQSTIQTISHDKPCCMDEEFCVWRGGHICTAIANLALSQKFRIPHYNHESLGWRVEHVQVPRRPQIHIYIMEKNLDAPEV